MAEGVITVVELMVGVIKSRQPNFDLALILYGYNYGKADDVQKLLEEIQPMARAFVDKLGFSIDDDDEDDK